MRTLKITLAFLMIAAILFSCIGCGNKTFISVNGQKVRKDEFFARLEKVPVQTQNGNQQAGQYVVEQLINEKLILDYAKSKDVYPTKEQISKKTDFLQKNTEGGIKQILAARGITKEELEKQIEVEQALVNVVSKGITVTDSEMKTTYDQTLNAPNSQLKRPEQAMISVIVCKTKSKMDKAYAELQKGADFNNTAKSLSDDPTAKLKTPGMIGWISRNMKGLPPSIANAAFSQTPNAYSSPIQTAKNEWVIVKTHQKRPARTTSFGDIKDAIKEQISIQKGNQAGKFKEDLKKFIKSANIKINSSKYKGIADMIKKKADAPVAGGVNQPAK